MGARWLGQMVCSGARDPALKSVRSCLSGLTTSLNTSVKAMQFLITIIYLNAGMISHTREGLPVPQELPRLRWSRMQPIGSSSEPPSLWTLLGRLWTLCNCERSLRSLWSPYAANTSQDHYLSCPMSHLWRSSPNALSLRKGRTRVRTSTSWRRRSSSSDGSFSRPGTAGSVEGEAWFGDIDSDHMRW